MVVGVLGTLVFQTSIEKIRTIDNVKWSGSARWATHERHNYHALTEFTGIDPDEITLSMYLSAYLGTNPMQDMVTLWTYEREGTPVPLVIGGKAYGKYRWTIVNHKSSFETYDRKGNVTSCTVEVKLVEYLRT